MSNLDASCLEEYPPYNQATIDRALESALARNRHKLVVLDDDPTGVQTVHDIYVYTDWSRESMQLGMDSPERVFFILTNSRAFSEDRTRIVHREIAENLLDAAGERPFILVSRGDSTLRGHYPLETAVLCEELYRRGGIKTDGEVICPFFPEGGRFTVGNIHYVRYGDQLIPAGDTEFAKDQTFGYQMSDLTCWVEEKTHGCYPAESVTVIALEQLRAADYAGITAKLCAISNFDKVVVNAVSYDDLKVFATSYFDAIQQGKSFIFRSAAALVKVLGGISNQLVLTSAQLQRWDNARQNGGLIIVGSHVQKTTDQLERLHSRDDITFIELNQHLVVSPMAFEVETKRVIAETETAIAAGRTVAVYTRRERLDMPKASKEEQLMLATAISDKVTSVVARLKVRPAFLVAKGGITSSDVGTKALSVKKALVLGQILPGVPVWLTGAESKFPQLPYVIFPGNVGNEDGLLEVVNKFI